MLAGCFTFEKKSIIYLDCKVESVVWIWFAKTLHDLDNIWEIDVIVIGRFLVKKVNKLFQLANVGP